MQLSLKENFWNTITALADPAKDVLSSLLGFWIKPCCLEFIIVCCCCCCCRYCLLVHNTFKHLSHTDNKH